MNVAAIVVAVLVALLLVLQLTGLAGEILAKLKVALSTTDADFVVKLIDVYPDNHPNYPHNPKNILMGGYQQLVRSEVFRGRFRNSFEKPEPFVPGQITDVNVPLQDVLHTFKKGHRIMIQIQSSWFPLVDRNPQTFVPIRSARPEDFQPATQRLYRTPGQASALELQVIAPR